MATRVIYKNAGDGKIMTKREAVKNPKTTYGQTVKTSKKSKSSK